MSEKMNKATWRITSTLFCSIIAVMINYIITFTLTPYITKHIGIDAYGFVSLAKTLANYGIVITSCLNAYAARYVTLAYHEGDLKKSNNYFSSIVLANVGLLIAVVFFEIFFIWKLQVFIRIPKQLLLDVKLLFFLDIFNNMCMALVNTFTVSAYIRNRLDRVEKVKAIAYIVEALILILLFGSFSARVFYVGVALLSSTIVLGVLNFNMKRQLTPDLRVNINDFSWEAVKNLLLSGMWNSLNSIGNMLNSGVDLWVTNLKLSALSMGQLSIVKTISVIYSTLMSILSRPFQPYLLKKFSAQEQDDLVSIFKFQIKFSSYVSNMMVTGLLTFGAVYYELWTPNQDIDLLYGITVVTVIGFLFEGMVQPLFYIYTLTLKNKIPCFVTIASGFLNVLGMYVLLTFTNTGLYAVVGTTTVLGFFTYFIFTPIYSAKCLHLRWYVFYPSIFRVTMSAILIFILVMGISRFYMPHSWLTLVVVALIACVIGIPIHAVCVFNKNEIEIIFKRLRKK